MYSVIAERDLEDIEVNRDGDLANRLPDNWEIIREQEEQAARRADDDQPQVLLPYVDDAHLNRRGEELPDQPQVLLPYVDDAHLNRRGQELDDQLQVLLPYVDDAHLNVQKEEKLDDQPQVLLPYGQRHLNAEGQRVFDPPHLSLLPYIPEGADYRRDGDVPPADQPQVLLPYVDNRQAQQDDQEPEIAWEDDDDWAEFYGERTELLEEDEQTEGEFNTIIRQWGIISIKAYIKQNQQKILIFYSFNMPRNFTYHNYNDRHCLDLRPFRLKREFCKKCLRYDLPRIVNTTSSNIITKIYTHSFYGFCGHIKLRVFEKYPHMFVILQGGLHVYF